MLRFRSATAAHLGFLVAVDLKDEGVTPTGPVIWDAPALAEHRKKIAAFVQDSDKGGWVCDDIETGHSVAVILWRYRNRLHETFETWSIIGQLDESLFPPDGAVCEIFQLWVAPEYRRRGLATRLKRQAEDESLRRGITRMYTHTEARNLHVIELNLKLGYREVRRGPNWDEVVRVSLMKSIV